MKNLYLSGVLSLSFTIMATLSSVAYADPNGCKSKGKEGCTTASEFCFVNKSLGKMKQDDIYGVYDPFGTWRIYECKWEGEEDGCKDKNDHYMKCEWDDAVCLAEMYAYEISC